MRIKTIAGLALAGAAATVAVALGGAAYAEVQNETGRVAPAVTTEENSRTGTEEVGTARSATPWDCPEKSGPSAGDGSGPAPSPGQTDIAAEPL